MKTFYILRNTDKLQTRFIPFQVFENIQDAKSGLRNLTTTHWYWIIYKVERHAVSSDEAIDLDPERDEAAMIHIFQLGWELFFQPIQSFASERRTSYVHKNLSPDSRNMNIIRVLLPMAQDAAIFEQQNTYMHSLKTFLKPDFHKKNVQEQWEEIFSLRFRPGAFKLFNEFPKWSCELLQNVANQAGATAQNELLNSTTLKPLFERAATLDFQATPIVVVSDESPAYLTK